MKVLLAAAFASLALSARATGLDLSMPRDPAAPAASCDSTVVQRCPPRAGATPRPDSYRVLEQRRGAEDVERILEAVVIEGERPRRAPGLNALLASRAPPPPGVSYEQTRRADGGVCTCSSTCALAPIVPCCVCSPGGGSAAIRGTVK